VAEFVTVGVADSVVVGDAVSVSLIVGVLDSVAVGLGVSELVGDAVSVAV